MLMDILICVVCALIASYWLGTIFRTYQESFLRTLWIGFVHLSQVLGCLALACVLIVAFVHHFKNIINSL